MVLLTALSGVFRVVLFLCCSAAGARWFFLIIIHFVLDSVARLSATVTTITTINMSAALTTGGLMELCSTGFDGLHPTPNSTNAI